VGGTKKPDNGVLRTHDETYTRSPQPPSRRTQPGQAPSRS